MKKTTVIAQRTPEQIEAMRQTTMMFLALHKKSLTLEEGFSLIALWETTLLSKAPLEEAVSATTPDVKPAVVSSPDNTPHEITPEPVVAITRPAKVSSSLSTTPAKTFTLSRRNIAEPEPELEEEETDEDNIGNRFPATTSYVMPDNDDDVSDQSNLPDNCKLPPLQRFDNVFWQTGYRFKIAVKAKSYTDDHLNYSVQTLERPSQEEFDKHYPKFPSGDFTVHVYESRWVPGEGYTSIRITDQYCSFRPVRAQTAMAEKARPESLVDIVDWNDEPDAPYRIAFYDSRVHRVNYVYFKERPTERDIRTYDQTRFSASLQRRPQGV